MILPLVATLTLADFKVEHLKFLAGNWTAEVWGGTFEEVWTQPHQGTMVGLGRHTDPSKTTFMEFMSIEKAKEGDWTLYIQLGFLSKGAKAPVPFKLAEFEPSRRVLFVNPNNEFPTHIEYSRSSKNEMKCVIYGRADGTKEEQVFNFKRAR